MKHIVRKNLLRGAGGKKPKVEAAILRPPQLGKFEIANSYSIAEITDLISDGPIDGLVNQNGKLVKSSTILQGIYLDNTPIEVTNNLASNDVSFSLFKNSDLTADTSYFSSLVRNIALNSFSETFQAKAKFPIYFLQAFFAPFFYTTFRAAYSVFPSAYTNQFGFHQGSDPITMARTDNAGFRPLTLNTTCNPSMVGEPDLSVKSATDRYLNYATSLWYVANYSYNGNNSSSTIYAKDQVTANTRWEMHYYNASSTATTLTSSKSIFTEYKTRLQNEINNANNNSIYISYLNKLKTLVGSVESLQIGTKSDSLFVPNKEVLLVLKVGEYDSSTSSTTTPVNFSTGPNTNKSITDLTKPFQIYVENMEIFPQENIVNLLIPKVNSSNVLTGEFYGLVVIRIPLQQKTISVIGSSNNNILHNAWTFDKSMREFVKKNLFLHIQEDYQEQEQQQPRKFNFGNVLCEFRDGQEQQKPLNNFNNIHVDYEYGGELYGPFRLNGEINRIAETSAAILQSSSSDIYKNTNQAVRTGGTPTVDENNPSKEGSQDSLRSSAGNAYANWNDKYEYNEKAIPVVHTIENPNVKQVYFTLAVNALKDTLTKDIDSTLKAGDSYPSVLVVSAEWGKVKNGQYTIAGYKEFTIICQVHGQMLIDFGSPTLTNLYTSLYPYIISSKDGIAPFILPDLGSDEDPSSTKRYIKITKVSTETNSVLIKRDVSLAKVTEIIDNNLSYPFSSIAGIKLDARTFNSIPERSYDCRLKKIKVPSNYFPIDSIEQTDKRYINSASSYSGTNQVYIGDWDGTFDVRWTDNPAWILFDLLTDKRYGLGGYIDESQINIWELYKIGRFCDAVDDNGYFIGVSDGVGGLEPRYSCNVMFKDSTKLFDAINVIANLFRGVVFFANSEIHFLDDRPRTPVALFSNSNVKNGEFTYNNYRRDQQYNTVEVAYLDRFDNYKTKIEFVEDEVDIRKRGVFKTTINTLGVTSRAMARRIGQHIIYQTLKENQGVEFSAGLETLLCRPGDLILIEDELKTRSTNYGRILDINLTNKSLIIENEYDNTDFTGKLTVYTPTGYYSASETEAIAQRNRSRMEYFSITGTNSVITSSLTGNYYFSGYVTGYPTGYGGTSTTINYPTQFANYTGKHTLGHDLYAYYNTGVTGWVFATGLAFSNNNTYDKAISNTGVMYISEISNASGYKATGYSYDSTVSNRRGATSADISLSFYLPTEETNGILDSEINLTNIAQITTFNITGYTNASDSYANTVYIDTGDININLLPFVALGSPYRIQRKNASDQIYKIVSIREDNPNEYKVVASKYDTGKFEKIENFSSEDFLPDTYYSGPISVNSTNINQLAAPVITAFATGTTSPTAFQLTGSWNAVTSATGYETTLINSITQYSTSTIHSSATTSYTWTGLNDIGRWDLKIRALGNRSSSWDSEIAKTGTFVVYQTITKFNRASVLNFKILR